MIMFLRFCLNYSIEIAYDTSESFRQHRKSLETGVNHSKVRRYQKCCPQGKVRRYPSGQKAQR